MKLHYLLLPAALLFAACGNEELEGVQPNLPVTKNLKAENDYQTYKNIYNWLIKNIKYPWGMFLTSDHTTSLSINAVYAKAMLTCLRRCAIRRASLAHVLMATWFPWAHTLGTMFTWMVIGM